MKENESTNYQNLRCNKNRAQKEIYSSKYPPAKRSQINNSTLYLKE